MLAERSGKLELALHAHTWRVSLMLELGDLAGVDQSIEAIAQIAGALGEPRARAYVPLVRAIRALLDGRVEQAEQLNMSAAELASEVTQDAIVPMIIAAQLFWIRWTQGRVSELEPAVRHMAETYPLIPSWRCALMACLREAGRRDELRWRARAVSARADFATLPARQRLAGRARTDRRSVRDRRPRRARRDARGDARAVRGPSHGLADRGVRRAGQPLPGPARRRARRPRRRAGAARPGARGGGAARRPADARDDRARRGPRASGARRATPGATRAREAAALAERAGARGAAPTRRRARRSSSPERGLPSRGRTAAGGGADRHRHAGRRQASSRRETCGTSSGRGARCCLRDSKGLRYLAQLLADPGVEMHSLDLVAHRRRRARRRAQAQGAARATSCACARSARTACRRSTIAPSASTAGG